MSLRLGRKAQIAWHATKNQSLGVFALTLVVEPKQTPIDRGLVCYTLSIGAYNLGRETRGLIEACCDDH